MSRPSRRGSFWILGAGTCAAAAALSGGCSILFHADASQCATSADCIARGTNFANYTCNLGTCVPPVDAMTGPSSDGGAEAQAPPCTKNSDCPGVTDPCQSGIACDVDTGKCLQLTTSECGYVIGDYCGADETPNPIAPPIFLGAFATFPVSNPLTHPSYLNYELAISEFAAPGYPGIPAGPGSGLRTPVVVACDDSGNLGQAMTHLIGDLGIPSIVAPLAATDLATVFTTYAFPSSTNPGTFMINPFGADSTLTSLQTDGLLWHMLGSPGDTAPAYAAFMPLVENYVRNNAPWTLGTTAPLKVATVTAPAQVLNDLAGAVDGVLTWNDGQNIEQNTGSGVQPDAGSGCACPPDGNYCSVQLPASALNGTDPTTIDYTDAVNCLAQFGPQVVISYASSEFTYLIEYLEAGTGLRPFYLLSPYNVDDTVLASWFVQVSPSETASRIARFAGINFASAVDPTVLDAYETRFLAMPGSTGAIGLGEENYYDAMYFAIYSLAGVGRKTVTGKEIGAAMTDLIAASPPATAYDVGPGSQMGSIFSALDDGQSISLVGTLGPPNFNVATGARIGQGDVYCISEGAADGGGSGVSYVPDVLRLTNPDGGVGSDGGSTLEGTFPCYPGIQ